MLLTIICLLILVFSAWYVPFRFKQLLGLKKIWLWQTAAFVALAGYWGIIATGIYTSTNTLIATIYNVYGLYFIVYVYSFLCLIIIHVFSCRIKSFSGFKVAMAGILLSLGLVGYGFIQAQSFTVTSHEIQVKGLAQPISIMHITDLHLNEQRSESYLGKVIETVGEYNPDIVLYSGDLVDSNIALRPELFSLFRNIKAEQYFTTGNHEFYIDTAKAFDLIADAGIRILRTEMVETHGIQLIGLEYMNADRVTFNSHMVNNLTIEEELPKISRDKNKPTLLAHHSPAGLQYVSKGQIDVMVAGHTHGGQLFPGTVLTSFMFPVSKGLYKIEDMTLLVSQGAGTFGPWMRLGTFNELQLIKLIPAD